MGHHTLRILFFAAVLLAFSTACSTTDTSLGATSVPGMLVVTGEYQTLSLDAFASILQTQRGSYTIVNVHSPYDGEIEGTDLRIPYDDIDALITALPRKDALIILYCRSGRMSEIASRALLELGYTQIWDVPGGMTAWQESGRGLLN